MSKSLPMLPSLAGGSGVAAHVLDDADLVHVVDAVTLDADRDRKVTLAELKTLVQGTIPSDLAGILSAIQEVHTSTTTTTGISLPTGGSYDVTLDSFSIPSGTTWIIDGWVTYLPQTASSLTNISVGFEVPGSTTLISDRVYGTPGVIGSGRSLTIPRTVINNPTGVAQGVKVRVDAGGSGTFDATYRFVATRLLP